MITTRVIRVWFFGIFLKSLWKNFRSEDFVAERYVGTINLKIFAKLHRLERQKAKHMLQKWCSSKEQEGCSCCLYTYSLHPSYICWRQGMPEKWMEGVCKHKAWNIVATKMILEWYLVCNIYTRPHPLLEADEVSAESSELGTTICDEVCTLWIALARLSALLCHLSFGFACNWHNYDL